MRITLGFVMGLALAAVGPVQAATFTVNHNGSDTDVMPGDGVCLTAASVCTLYAAIQEANAFAGADTIAFNLPAGALVIPVPALLPAVTQALTIDGTTQPGFAGVPLVQINATGGWTTTDGLRIHKGNTTVRGLMITRFASAGVYIGGGMANLGGSIVAGCYLGTDGLPTSNGPNSPGNAQYGVLIDGVPGNTIGGTTTADRNIISSSHAYGVAILNATGNVVVGNYIGTDPTGTFRIGNGASGVFLQSASSNRIGGTTPEERNIISGNYNEGIRIGGGSRNLVQGNYIGTDVTGTQILGNTGRGITMTGEAQTIGGVMAGAGNVISGNYSDGLHASGLNTVVQGNYIGTNAAGTAALGNQGVGINAPFTSTGLTIGGTVPGAGNVVSGNRLEGIAMRPGTQMRVSGNLIGTGADGVTPIGNGGDGITVTGIGGTGSLLVGGPEVGAGNLIAHNGGRGLVVLDTNTVRVQLQRNRIFGNAGLEVDLGGEGATANDPGDADEGMNRLQNTPVLTASEYDLPSNTVRVTFTVDTAPANATYPLRIEFFRAQSDGGDLFLGSLAYTSADAQTVVTRAFTPEALVTGSEALVATATDAEGNTSEFSLARALPVELGPLTATVDGAIVRLAWTTASETNNAGFAVEQQNGPRGWKEVAPFVRGHGTTGETHRYAATVGQLAPGPYTFRLRQLDFDGTATYSATVEVTVAPARAMLTVYPNPAKGPTNAVLTLPGSGAVRAVLYDGLGRAVATVFEGHAAPVQAFALPVASVGAGWYLLRVEAPGVQLVQHVLVVR